MISDVIGYHQGQVIAEDCDGNLFTGSPELVPELADNPYAALEPATYARKCCVAATLRPEDWRWSEFTPSNPGLFKHSLQLFNRERFGFPYWTRRNKNDDTAVIGA